MSSDANSLVVRLRSWASNADGGHCDIMDDAADMIESLASQRSSGIKWREIQTAPKDGTRVLLFYPELGEPCQLGEFRIVEHFSNGKLTHRHEGWIAGLWIYPGKETPVPSHWSPVNSPKEEMS